MMATTKIRQHCAGFNLLELLCVIAIISILAALYLRVIVHAFHHVLNFLKGF